MSAKNLTIYLSAETAKKMDQIKEETNWSKIARDAIEKYINDKTQTALPTQVLERLRREMDQEYSDGRKFAVETLAPQLTYKNLDNFFTASNLRAEADAEELANDMGYPVSEVRPNYDGAAKKLLKEHFPNVPKDISDKFTDGVFEVLKGFWNELKGGGNLN
jgi:predicted DNA-binding protein